MTLVVIDGNYFAYRFFHSQPTMTGPGNRLIGVTFAFASLFRDLRQNTRITHWALALDHPGKSFRHELYPPYKDHRPPMPDELRSQLADIEELATQLGVPCLKVPGYEADDVLATLARQAAASGMDAWICTKDKDIDQVLDDRISTWDPIKGILRGVAELAEERQLRPDQVIDFLCMVGDSADNVPGIRLVGPKNALRFLETYGSLQGLLDHAEEVPGKKGEHIVAFREQAGLTRKLITLADVPDLPPLERLHKSDDRIAATADDWLRNRGLRPARFLPEAAKPPAPQTRLLDLRGLRRLLDDGQREWPAQQGLAIHPVRTTGPNPLWLGLALAPLPPSWLSTEASGGAYLPFLGASRDALVDPTSCLRQLQHWIRSNDRHLVGCTGQVCDRLFQDEGVSLDRPVHGLDLAAWLLAPTAGDQALTQVLPEKLSAERLQPAYGLDALSMPVSDIAGTAARTAMAIDQAYAHLNQRLLQADLLSCYQDLELPTQQRIAGMESYGMRLDLDSLDRMRRDLEAYQEQLYQDIHGLIGYRLDPEDDEQLQHLLYRRFEILESPQTSQRIDRQRLEELRDLHPFAELLAQLHDTRQLLGDFHSDLRDRLHPTRHELRPCLRSTGDACGTIACRSPDLTLLPPRRNPARHWQQTVVARPEHTLVSLRLPFLQERIWAHLHGDPAFVACCAQADNPYRHLAARLFDKDPVAVDSRDLDLIRHIHRQAQPGGSSYVLARACDLEREQAQQSIDAYRKLFINATSYGEALVKFASENGYITTLSQRKLFLPRSSPSSPGLPSQTIISLALRGSAADFIKHLILRCRDWLPEAAHLCLATADELLIESHDAHLEHAEEALHQLIKNTWTLKVPPDCRVGIGPDWLACQR